MGVAIAAATLMALSGCSSTASQSSTPRTGGTLVYASGDAEPTCLDPHVGGNYPQALLGAQIFETLVGRNAKGTILPWLAKSWSTSSDGRALTFNLRSGIKFTDGTAFDAAAVKANIQHVQDPATGSSTGYLALQRVSSIDVVSPTQVRLNLSEPDSALLDSLSQVWIAMESPTGIARGQKANCLQPVGTGPFKVSSWTPQQDVALVRNDAYVTTDPEAKHKGKAYLSKVTWRFIPDVSTRYAALQSGQVQVIDNPQPETVSAALKKSSKITAIQAPRPGSVNRLELNMSKAPFNDIKVRQAFVKSANVDPGIKSLFFGTVKRSTSALSSVEPDAYSDPSLFTTDTTKANKLLDEAGWKTKDSEGYRTKDGQRLTVTIPVSTNQSVPAEQSLFEQIQAATKKVGFEVKLEPLDLSSWYAALGKDEYNAVSAPYTKVGPDVLRILYDTKGITPAPSGYFANHSQLSDAKLDSLLSQALASSSASQRKSLYLQAQKRILNADAILPLYDQQNNFLVGSKANGVRIDHTISTPTLLDAWLSK